MTIAVSLLDTSQLLGIFRYTLPVSSYWRTLGFPNTFNSDDQFIDMEKIVPGRKLAPLVTPMSEGRPIFDESSNLSRFKPAYLKPKDVLDPTRVTKKRAGELFSVTPMTMQQRADSLVASILQSHRESIERRLEWMAAKALLDAKITLVDDNYPTRIVDFQRDAGQTIALAGAALWNGASANVLGNINAWRSLVRRNVNGGAPVTRMTVGSDVAEVLVKDPGVLELMDTTVRDTKGDLNIGIREGDRIEFLGRINTLEIYVNSDTYQENGVEVNYMSPKDILMTGAAASINGYQAFGAILDKKAGYQPLSVFPKMWDEEDPSATQIMTQSSPLLIPVNPNATLKATVLV